MLKGLQTTFGLLVLGSALGAPAALCARDQGLTTRRPPTAATSLETATPAITGLLAGRDRGVTTRRPPTAATSLETATPAITGLLAGRDRGVTTLRPPTEATSLETATPAITGLLVRASRLLLLPGRAPGVVLDGEFHAQGEQRQAVFGRISAQQRVVVAAKAADWDLIGADLRDGRALFFEGLRTEVIESDDKTLQEIVRRSVPWDLIKPPADRGGEATRPETAALRAAFKRAWLATSGLRVTGMARLPEAWGKRAKATYLLATRLPGFPLLEMECGSDEPSACVISRQCYLEGADELAAADVTGLAVSAKRRLVLLGDRGQRQLLSFHYDSCYHVPRRAAFALPKQLKTLTNLAVDSDDRLWVTTLAPDDYLNASVFFWPKDAW